MGLRTKHSSPASVSFLSLAAALAGSVSAQALATEHQPMLDQGARSVGMGVLARAETKVDAQLRIYELPIDGPQSASGEPVPDRLVVSPGEHIQVIDAAAVEVQEGDAYAHASVGAGMPDSPSGLLQYASSKNGDPAASIENRGTISALATANVKAPSKAFAEALIRESIFQQAFGEGSASVALSNADAAGIDISANALAEGMNAAARATVLFGISQLATSTGGTPAEANAALSNSGAIDITADAVAIGTGADEGGLSTAVAVAFVWHGVKQSASAVAGDDGTAVAALSNDGEINTRASASAEASAASALSYVGPAISQQAQGSNSGAVVLTNGGEIDVVAEAAALGSFHAAATAHLFGGIDQRAAASGTAEVALSNGGSIDIHADAQASATGGSATPATGTGLTTSGVAEGTAYLGAGIYQSVSALKSAKTDDATGTASAQLTNSGALSVTASAVMSGSNFAYANALIGKGVGQSASAGDNAAVSLDNSGELSVAAVAHAVSTGLDGSGGTAIALANAVGIAQSAISKTTETSVAVTASGDTDTTIIRTPHGKAAVELANSGRVDVAVVAIAEGDQAAVAIASTIVGVDQFADGTSASAWIENSGAISVGYDLNAVAGSTAAAFAFMTGIQQVATAVTATTLPATESGATPQGRTRAGPASASLTNSGTIAVSGSVSAINFGDGSEGLAGATGLARGIDQLAAGADAEAIITNSGTIIAEMDALASGQATAAATRVLAFGMGQIAVALTEAFYPSQITGETVLGGIGAGPALALLENSGRVEVGSNARAIADNFAIATAGAVGLQQSASGRTAAARVENAGVLDIDAVAVASGNFAVALNSAVAVIQRQEAATEGSQSVHNSGMISVGASSDAVGAEHAVAQALAFGVSQKHAVDGVGQLLVDNSGTYAGEARAKSVGQAYASAGAVSFGIEQFSLSNDIALSVVNSGTIMNSAEVEARADGGDGGVASANLTLVGLNQTGLSREVTISTETLAGFFLGFADVPSGPVSISLSNSGTIAAVGTASASANEAAIVGAVGTGVWQGAAGSDVDLSISNDGTILYGLELTAAGGIIANASGDLAALNQVMTGYAHQMTVTQTAGGLYNKIDTYSLVGPASLSLANSGSIEVGGSIEAIAPDGIASADMLVTGVVQYAAAADVSLIVVNEGDLGIGAAAEASGVTAIAVAAVNGIYQAGSALAYVNSSLLLPGTGTGTTIPTGTGTITGFAVGWGNLAASASSPDSSELVGPITASIANSGTFEVGAAAVAAGAELATADASVSGMVQEAMGTSVAMIAQNSGDVAVMAFASAEGANASAAAFAGGMLQVGTGSVEGSAFLDNSGVYAIDVHARGQGDAVIANALGVGVSQFLTSPSASVEIQNAGEIDVTVAAAAEGGTRAEAAATALGLAQAGSGGAIEGAFANAGEIDVIAMAEASASGEGGVGSADAYATGYSLAGADVSTNIANSGALNVGAAATAEGDESRAAAFAVGIDLSAGLQPSETADTLDGGALSGTLGNSGNIDVAVSASAADASASAVGIRMSSGSNALTLTNSGHIEVTAATNGGAGSAVAILAESQGSGSDEAGDLLAIINDGGTVVAAISDDGGETFSHGLAIDVSGAPNRAMIELRGDGGIYGHIDLAAGDTILVAGGETWFDGIVNPLGEREGSLTIASGGTLFLRNNPAGESYAGAARANVDSFTMAGGAILALEVPVDVPGAGHGQVFANSASLDGTLEIRALSANGLFKDILLQDVIVAETLTGEFDTVELLGAGALLSAQADYGEGNVDVRIERTAFGQLGGETANQAAVGAGIEAVYDTDLEGPFAELLAEFFTFDEAGVYNALDQLSGAHYASYLTSLRNSALTMNDLVSNQVDCAVAVRGIGDCHASEPRMRAWAMGGYAGGETDADANAPGFDSEAWFAMLGADYAFGNVILGGFAGYRDSDTRFDKYNAGIEAKGLQFGVHGAYDTGAFYVRGLLSHAMLDGESKRSLSVGSFAGTIEADADANVTSLYGEAGARLALGSSWLTPFLGFDHIRVELKGFTEQGVPGANLQVQSQSETHTSAIAGVKWAGQWGGLVPEAKLAFRHTFGDRDIGFKAIFADAPAGSSFRVVGPETDRGSVVVGLALSTDLSTRFSGRFGYQGSFGESRKDHALTGSIKWLFGGAPGR